MADHELKFNYKINISSMILSELKKWISGHQLIEESSIEELKEEEKRIESIKEIEKNLYNKGYKHIAGIDETEKGALASPVTSAVIFPKGVNLMEVDDSKKLPLNKREDLYARIVNQALLGGAAWFL